MGALVLLGAIEVGANVIRSACESMLEHVDVGRKLDTETNEYQ
jgi:hypothetical protein